MSKEYNKNYYENNKMKLQQYYVDNKDNFKKNDKKFRLKKTDTNEEHYKLFLEFLELIKISKNDNEYLIDSKIYKNDLVNQYVNDNLDLIKKLYFEKDYIFKNIMKTEKIATNILKYICKTMSIETKNIIKAVKLENGKRSTNLYIQIII